MFLTFAFLVFDHASEFDWNLNGIELSFESFAYMALATSMVLANWYLEYYKWLLSVPEKTERSHASQAFFAGMISGFLTPSYFGNFIGRSLQFNAIRKRQIISLTLVANFSQFIISLLFGIIGLVVIREWIVPVISVFALTIAAVIVLVTLLVFVQFHHFGFLQKLVEQRDLDLGTVRLRIQMLLLSASRFVVFSTQFYLVFHAFSSTVTVEYWFGVWVMYLFMTVSPSLLSGKLLIRESIAVFVFSLFGEPVATIVLVAFVVWFINNALPTAFAFLMMKRNVS